MNQDSKLITIHTSRTMMLSEFSRIMENGLVVGSFEQALDENAASKLTKSNQQKTNDYLRRLYGFRNSDKHFVALRYFWEGFEVAFRPIFTLLIAVNNDFLLKESIDVVSSFQPGSKVPISSFEENIETYHPAKYSSKTRLSAAQNIASSWKQAGFILGKIKNIRVQPEIHYSVVAFALFLAHLDGLQGDFIFNHPSVKALCLPESKIRELAHEAAKRDLINYQHSGGVTVFNFNNLKNKINENGILS